MTTCGGCGEKLDGIVAHAMHICPTPVVTKLSDAPMRDKVEYQFPPMGKAMYEAVEACLKEMRDKLKHKL